MRNHKRPGILVGLGAGAAALALALTPLVASAAPAVDPDTTGSLTITKLTNPDDVPATGTGAQIPTLPTGSDPIENVTFKVTPIEGIDLSTNQGWIDAAKLSVTTNGTVDFGGLSDVELGTPLDNQKTNSSGIATWTGMPIGVYFVEEVDVPGTTPPGLTGSQPFLVTIPITDPADRDEWLYNVYVYPKNSQVDFTKTVNDAAPYTVGTPPVQKISYDLTAVLPTNIDGEGNIVEPTGFVITDVIASGLTVVAETDITAKFVEADGTPISVFDASGTNWTATNSGAQNATVTITAGAGGLAAMGTTAENYPDSKVVFTVTATVAQGITSMAAIANQAHLSLNAMTPNEVELNSESVSTYWGPLEFTKVDGEDDPLAGAEFKLFLNEADARAGADTNAIRGGTAASSDAEGVVTINGLRASDFANGEPASPGTYDEDESECAVNSAYIVYWLTETAAPTGFELLAEPIPVVLGSDGALKQVTSFDMTASAETEGAACNYTTDPTSLSKIENVEKNAGFTLPLTGGVGTLALTVGGVALLAVVLFVIARRRTAGVDA